MQQPDSALSSLLAQYPSLTGITADSRAVTPSSLFVVTQSTHPRIADFLKDALAKGVQVILADADLPKEQIPASVTVISHPNPRYALAVLASLLYAPQPDKAVAVTGTNGKSSIVHFCRSLWQQLAKHGEAIKGASIGTLGAINADGTVITYPGPSLTTPDTVALQRLLQQLVHAGGTHIALEASSHGLDQYRLHGVQLLAAAFTNLTRDHLDYHGDMEQYFQAKMRLFTEVLPEGKTAVLNADLPEYPRIRAICESRHQKIVSYGYKGDTYRLTEVEPLAIGQRISFTYQNTSHSFTTQVVGNFQAHNLLCALALVSAANPEYASRAIPYLTSLPSVPGRMELVSSPAHQYKAVIDYAHTPDALEKALEALRAHVKGKLIAVFGCGGDRDPGKRPVMGEIAATLADYVIITDDNPRTENPDPIRQAIYQGAKGVAKTIPLEIIGDREAAIRKAISILTPEDMVLIAGKGHEKYQIIGERSLPFDDVEIATMLLKEHENR